MKEIRNASGKLVCCVSGKDKLVEIVHKGIKTHIRFHDNGRVEVINYVDKEI